MPKPFLLEISPRDADAPGFHDLRVNLERLARTLAGAPCLKALCGELGMTRQEALRQHTPGA